MDFEEGIIEVAEEIAEKTIDAIHTKPQPTVYGVQNARNSVTDEHEKPAVFHSVFAKDKHPLPFIGRREVQMKTKIRYSKQCKQKWRFMADTAERLNVTVYIIFISVTPFIIFFILPALYSKDPTLSLN